MIITAVVVNDMSNPVELQIWFNEHPNTEITRILVQQNIFYIFCV